MIQNFRTVKIGKKQVFYRGGQPRMEEDWQQIKDLGITQIIKLNPDNEGEDRLLDGVQLFKCPISVLDQVTPIGPSRQTIEDAAGFIGDKTFCHCSHGEDRTSLVCAVYRVKHCGWTKEEAFREMITMGFHSQLIGLLFFWERWQWETDAHGVSK